MIYNENGIIINEYECVNVFGNRIDLSIFNENSHDDPEMEGIINGLKIEIQKCDETKINKLNKIEKREYLSERAESLIKKISIAGALLNVPVGVGGLVSVLNNGFNALSTILIIAFGVLSTLVITLATIIGNNDKKYDKKDKDILNLARECADTLLMIANDPSKPIKVKYEALNNLIRIKTHLDKYDGIVQDQKIKELEYSLEREKRNARALAYRGSY